MANDNSGEVLIYKSMCQNALLENVDGADGDAEGDVNDTRTAVVTIQAEGVFGVHPKNSLSITEIFYVLYAVFSYKSSSVT